MVAAGYAVGHAVADALNPAPGIDRGGYGHAFLQRTLWVALDLIPLICAASVASFARGDDARQAKSGGIDPCLAASARLWPQFTAGRDRPG